MYEDLYIIGAGSVGGHLAVNLSQYSQNFVLRGFLDDHPKKIGTDFCGFPVLGPVSEVLTLGEVNLVLGIAFPKIKKQIHMKLRGQSRFNWPTFVHRKAWVSRGVEIGPGSIIYPGSSINYGSHIGSFVVMNMNCAIGHDTTIGNFASLAPGVATGGHTCIEDGVDMGIGSSTIQDTVIGENGVRVDGIGTPDAFGYFPSTLPFEPDTAEALLDDAGWTRDGDGIRQRDGQDLEVEVMTAGTAPGQNEALQVMQQQWQQVGVRMEISLIDGGALNAQLESEAGDHEEDSTNLPDYQGFMLASGIRTGEVGYILGRPQCDSGNRNHERHCNPEYDEAFALSQSTASPEERLEGFEVMARIFEEEVLRLPIYVINLNVAASTSVQGFELNPNEALDLRGVSIDS